MFANDTYDMFLGGQRTPGNLGAWKAQREFKRRRHHPSAAGGANAVSIRSEINHGAQSASVMKVLAVIILGASCGLALAAAVLGIAATLRHRVVAAAVLWACLGGLAAVSILQVWILMR
jgi:hypothetical protein